MSYNNEEEPYKNKRNRKKGSKRDYSRYKKSKYQYKNHDNSSDINMDYEMLRIQNLQRCEVCNNIYSLDIRECPFCKGSREGTTLPTN